MELMRAKRILTDFAARHKDDAAAQALLVAAKNLARDERAQALLVEAALAFAFERQRIEAQRQAKRQPRRPARQQAAAPQRAARPTRPDATPASWRRHVVNQTRLDVGRVLSRAAGAAARQAWRDVRRWATGGWR
jgi:hypothetical protein